LKENHEYYKWAVLLEDHAQHILELLIQYESTPPPSAISEAKDFLLEVEKWKAGCLEQRIGNALENSEKAIWGAFQGALCATEDLSAIRAIMQLKGFGSSFDEETGQRRAKVATSVLRFFWPNQWGVVDWRNAAILGILKKSNWEVDRAITKARTVSARELRNVYEIIDEYAACEFNLDYRQLSENHPGQLPRAADVDMALFGLSLMVW
jgi:hypothetical protein